MPTQATVDRHRRRADQAEADLHNQLLRRAATEQRLEELDGELRDAKGRLAAAYRQMADLDAEAVCLAGCVAAIDTLLAAKADGTQRASWARSTSDPEGVTRLLLCLADRYAGDVVRTPPEPAPERVLVDAPGHLAGPLRALLENA